MNAEQIDEVLRADQGGVKTPLEKALRSLADLSVSVLRMIDSRRECGIAFDDSYNEQELRRALISMADQKFPPGAPMTPVRSSVLDEPHDFQRFRCLPDHLKIVCRCGWSSVWVDLDPDVARAEGAARDLLQAHVAEAIELGRRRRRP